MVETYRNNANHAGIIRITYLSKPFYESDYFLNPAFPVARQPERRKSTSLAVKFRCKEAVKVQIEPLWRTVENLMME